MNKKLDITKPVHDLVREYPELVNILKGLGFTEIAKPAMLQSVGRMMTIPRGAAMKGIAMADVIRVLRANGFEPAGNAPEHPELKKKGGENISAAETSTERIKGYLKRLRDGEDLESVRKDFAAQFSQVDASEIMKAEQELIKEGMPISEAQKLCDIHSALFHGATAAEKIANAEKAVAESLQAKPQQIRAAEQARTPERALSDRPDAYRMKQEITRKLCETKGHPLSVWTRENEKIGALIHEIQKEMEEGREIREKLAALRPLAIHYAKKGDLVYPILKVHYGISGPSQVMWSVDDEIRNELSALGKASDRDEKWADRVRTVLQRADEMIYKEANILFPLCAAYFTAEEWYDIYQDAKAYAPVFGVEDRWEEAEQFLEEKKAKNGSALQDGEIVMAGGHMTVAQLEALLNTLPLEITFVDAADINRFFNEGPKVFKRPLTALDREVYACHPPKIEPMVRAILDDFRNRRMDCVPVWMEKNGKPYLVQYMAVRDKNQNYLGTVEVVQDMQFAKEHFMKA